MTATPLNEIADELLDLLMRLRMHGSCLSCVYFNPISEGCQKADGQRPPARVIVMACNKYVEVVPF